MLCVYVLRRYMLNTRNCFFAKVSDKYLLMNDHCPEQKKHKRKPQHDGHNHYSLSFPAKNTVELPIRQRFNS